MTGVLTLIFHLTDVRVLRVPLAAPGGGQRGFKAGVIHCADEVPRPGHIGIIMDLPDTRTRSQRLHHTLFGSLRLGEKAVGSWTVLCCSARDP